MNKTWRFENTSKFTSKNNVLKLENGDTKMSNLVERNRSN